MSMKEYLEIFTRHVEKLAETDHYGDDGYTREFQTLKQRSAQYKINGTYSTDEGEKEWNKRKNRFKDILPYDYTRVKLVAVPGVSGSDYINANFLKGPNGQNMYIASQGPLLHTKVDFWRMVWEYDVNVVVMACNEYEGEKLKCARYWPQVGKSEKYGKINVRFEKEEKENQNFCIRHLVAEYGGVTRNVWQFHYGGWPDHGTPDIPSVLEMISVMRERQAVQLPPIIVHCSAGCGRTGTICAIDYAWHVLKLGLLTADFSLFNIIDEMRTQRNAIVQTKDQYVSVHHAVRDLFTRHLQVINEHNYENMALNGQVPASTEEYESVSYDESQYLEPSKRKPTTLTPPNQESPTERAIYSTVANLINANQIGTVGANNRMTRSSYGSTSDDSLQGPDIPYKTPEAYFPAHQAVLDIISGIDDHQIASQDETSAADSMTSSVIQFGKKIKRVVMGQSLSTSNHSDIKPVHSKDIYFKGKLINFPHRVDRPRRPAQESPYEVPRSTQVHRK